MGDADNPRVEARLRYARAAYSHLVLGETGSAIQARWPLVDKGNLSRVSTIIRADAGLLDSLTATRGEDSALKLWIELHHEDIRRQRTSMSVQDPIVEERVATFVLRARAVTATEISRSLGIPRSEVNSVLYSGVGRRFRRSDDDPPRWSILAEDRSNTIVPTASAPRVTAHHDFHVDFAGGDWMLRIVVAGGSRNDPVARVEHLGDRHRLITVAEYASGQSSEEPVSAAAVAIAASVLAWEIYSTMRGRGEMAFNFEEAVRDIFLSLSWQSAKVGSGEEK